MKWLVVIVILNELLMNTTHSIIFVIMSDCRTVNCLQLSSHKSCRTLEIRVNGCSDTLKKILITKTKRILTSQEISVTL